MTLFAALLFASGAAVLVMAFRKAPEPATASTETPWNRVSAKRKPALIEAAGLVYGTDRELSRLARQQVIATLTLGSLAALLIASSPSPTTVLAAVPMVMLGWKGPLMIVRSKEKKRRTEVDLELVDALGEMVMGVEAGLTLDVVMMRYAQARSTPLAEEFRTVLDRIQLGALRSEALAAMADRTPTPTVRMFSTALTQNQRLGTTFGGGPAPTSNNGSQATTSDSGRKGGQSADENDLSNCLLHSPCPHDRGCGPGNYSIDPCTSMM